jgi:enoyl-CoA hydratase
MHQEGAGPHAGMVVVRLEQPGRPVVVLDHELIQRLEVTLKTLPRDARGMVLASASERVFVAGADLKAISEWDDAKLMAYLEYAARVFGMIPALPFPTVAAINGAALGGGLELAMHCDGLVAAPGAKPYPVGLPEAGLGLCPGWGGTNLLPARMEPAEAIQSTASGKPLMFDEAKALGLFDRTADSQEALISTAMAWLAEQRKGGRGDALPLRWIGRPGRASSALAALDRAELAQTAAAAAVRAAVDSGLTKGWEAAIATERRELVRLRHTPEAKAALAAFFAKSAPKPAAS